MAARPTVEEVSAPYANFMRTPAPVGPDVCRICRTFTNGYATCFRCGHQPSYVDAVVPITYAPSTEQMHTALRSYKDGRTTQIRDRFSRDLLAVFWRFLQRSRRPARQGGCRRRPSRLRHQRQSHGSCPQRDHELGVLLRGGPEPARVRRHVEGLMAAGVLEPLT